MHETWTQIVAGMTVLMAGGFGAWMFRIDRGVQTMKHVARQLGEVKKEHERDQAANEREHADFWRRLGDLGERTARVEAAHSRGGSR